MLAFTLLSAVGGESAFAPTLRVSRASKSASHVSDDGVAIGAGRRQARVCMAADAAAQTTGTSSNGTRTIFVTGMWRYPLKSGAAEPLTTTRVQLEGLEGDRRYMVATSTDGKFVTQRRQPALATVRMSLQGSQLTLSAPGEVPLTVAAQRGRATVNGSVWGDALQLVDQGRAAAVWITRFLWRAGGNPLAALASLQPVPAFRLLGALPASGRAAGLADEKPLLLICEASLEELNARRLVEGRPPTPMERFRPNLVVRGCAPGEEDRWKAVSIGTAHLAVDGPCPRCTVPDVDQQTGKYQPRHGPMASLGKYRSQAGKGVLFGVWMTPTSAGGVVNVGDQVTIHAWA